MSDLSAADIAEGHHLDKAATGAPWETHVSRTDVLPGRETREIVRPNGDLHPWNVLKAGNTCCWPPTDADAELIVWARNHLAALLDAAEKLAAIEELHTPDAGHDPDCDCGVPAGADQDCNECCSEWPCATIRAINLEENR